MSTYRQQGDVIIMKINKDEIPQSAKRTKIQGNTATLAKGEATGHHHTVDNVTEAYVVSDTMTIEEFMRRHAEDFDPPFPEELIFVVCNDNPTIRHEEHGQFPGYGGTSVAWRVREYDHFAEEAREVID